MQPGEVHVQAPGRLLSLAFDNAEDHIAAVIRQTGGFYEAEMLADIRARLFFPVCAVDVGAHVGNHTLFLAHVLGVRTIAFEPNPASFARLEQNVRANALQDRCVLHNKAVGAMAGHVAAISDHPANSGMARVEQSEDGPIGVVRLDEALAQEARIDVVKIDVEGWEQAVIDGASTLLARHRPLLYIEVEYEAFDPLRASLGRLGYVCWKRFNATPTMLFLPVERLQTP